MARGVEITTVDPAALQSLTTALCTIWPDLVRPFRLFKAPSGANASTGNHLVISDHDGADSGVHVGLKAAERVSDGTLKEVLLGEVSIVLGLPAASRLHLLGPIPNLSSLAGKVFFAVRWLDNAEVFEKMPEPVKQAVRDHPNEFLECFGEWMGFGLTFGIQDRHNGNWVCSGDGCRVVMIDNEDAFRTEGEPTAYQGALQHFGLLERIRSERAAGGPHVDYLSAGLRRFAQKLHDRRAAVQAELSRHGWAQTYASRWMNMSVEEFVAAAVAGI